MSEKPFTMSRWCTVWHAEGEFEIDRSSVRIYERLEYSQLLTEKDRPHWENDYISFYRVDTKDWVRVGRHLMFSRHAIGPDLFIMPDGTIVEITGGQVIWRNDHWFICWRGYKHTRMALMVRAGLHWWRDPERAMPEANHTLEMYQKTDSALVDAEKVIQWVLDNRFAVPDPLSNLADQYTKKWASDL